MIRTFSTSSGLLSASHQVSTNPGALCGIDVSPPPSGQAYVTIYDSNTSDTTGKLILAEVYADAGLAGVNHEYTNPVVVNQGIYAVLTGTTDYVVRFAVG